MDVIDTLKERKETVWLNPDLSHFEPRSGILGYKFVHIKAAQNRFMRFMPYIASAFPETADRKGVIESGLIPIPAMKEKMKGRYGAEYSYKNAAHATWQFANEMKPGDIIFVKKGMHQILLLL